MIDLWTQVREKITNEMIGEMEKLDKTGRYLNPIYLMADSGARGVEEQIRQLAGMRGLMAKPSGKIIETPIKANFREGLTVLEYFISTHGARKGLADTALKTADSGYLTRKLADVAQNVVIHETTAARSRASGEGDRLKGEKIEPLRDRIVGRVSPGATRQSDHRRAGGREEREITEEMARQIEDAGIEKIQVRRPLTCASRSASAPCYGMDLVDRQAGRGGHGRRHHRRPVDRRAGHAAHDADVPHRRHGVAHLGAVGPGVAARGHRALRGHQRGADADRRHGRAEPQRRAS